MFIVCRLVIVALCGLLISCSVVLTETCGDEPACNPREQCKNGQCVTVCVKETTCPTGEVCQEGICTAEENPPNKERDCVVDGDCSQPLQCQSSKNATCVEGQCLYTNTPIGYSCRESEDFDHDGSQDVGERWTGQCRADGSCEPCGSSGCYTLILTAEPSTEQLGQPVSLEVEVRDALGQLVSDAGGNVTATVVAGTGVAFGDASEALQGGIATWGNLRIDQAGTDYQLSLTTDIAAPVTTSPFNVVDPSCPNTVCEPLADPIPLDSFAAWVRNPNNPIFSGFTGTELVAGDAHVWEESPGSYRMVYTDDFNDRTSIAMAISNDLVNWQLIGNSEFPNGVILGGAGPGGKDISLETAFYRKATDGKHQVYYIGYMDENVYNAAIYLAEASQIQGPYTRAEDPVITWTSGGPDAHAMTSPTIVEHEGVLYMTYIGWEAFPNGPVHVVGATSMTDGRSWSKRGALDWDDIFGVEAHTEKGPDGLFYRAGIGADAQGNDMILFGRSNHPFGPYTLVSRLNLSPAGPAVGEGTTIMSPSLVFDHANTTLYMHYAAVDTGGLPWITSVATSTYGQ